MKPTYTSLNTSLELPVVAEHTLAFKLNHLIILSYFLEHISVAYSVHLKSKYR